MKLEHLYVVLGIVVLVVIVVTGGRYPEPHYRQTGQDLKRIDSCLSGTWDAQAAAFKAKLQESGGDIGAALSRVENGQVKFYDGDSDALEKYRTFLICATRR